MSLRCPNCQHELSLYLAALAPQVGQQCVYLVRNPATKLVKIGYTANFPSRISQLRANAGIPLELVGVLLFDTESEARRMEERLHATFGTVRTWGEWFQDHPDIRSSFVRASL